MLCKLWLHLSIFLKHPSLWFYITSLWKFQKFASFARIVFCIPGYPNTIKKLSLFSWPFLLSSKWSWRFFSSLILNQVSLYKNLSYSHILFSYYSYSPLTPFLRVLKLCSSLVDSNKNIFRTGTLPLFPTHKIKFL